MTSRREFLKKAGLLTAAFTVPTLNTQGETTQSRLSLKSSLQRNNSYKQNISGGNEQWLLQQQW